MTLRTADGATNTGAPQPAISIGIFGQVLLVILFCKVEPVCGLDFCCNGAKATFLERIRISLKAVAHCCFLIRASEINSTSILTANIIALAIALGWIVFLPEFDQNVFECDFVWVVVHQNGLSMAGFACANVLVAWVVVVATLIPNRGNPHAIKSPEQTFGAPKAS